MQNRQTLILGGVVAVIIVLIGAYFLLGHGGASQKVSLEEPSDIVHDFYKSWLTASLSTTTNPYKDGLASSPILSKELRTKLKEANGAGGIDPVLCQTTLPADITVRAVSSSTDRTEMLVTARKSTSTEQAIVTLIPLNNGWYINDITCSPGEFPPVREFSFETDGFLLNKVPPPLDTKYWYLVYEENGKKGNFVKLLFTPTSSCRALDGKTAPCTPDTFVDATKAHLQGQMTEVGVQVVNIQMMKE